MKKLISVLLVLAVSLACVFSFAGCDIGTKGNDGETDTTTVLATVGDEKIYLHEFKATYDMYVEYYANYGYDITNDAEALKEFKTSLLNRMIAEKAALIKAKEAGLDEYTEEQKAEIADSLEKELTSIEEYYMPLAKEQVESGDEAEIQAKYEELVAEESVNYTGVKMTYEEFLDYVEKSITNNYLMSLYQKEIVYKDLKVEDSAIEDSYNERVNADKESFEATPADYKNAQESAELYESIPTAYTPEGYSRMLSILIEPKGETSTQYTDNETKMNNISSEYGDLAWDNAINPNAENAKKLNELVAEYKKLKAENEAEFTKVNAEYRTKAEEAYKALVDGKTFVEVMKEYGEDPDFNEGSVFIEKGVLISNEHKSSSDLSDEVKAEFKKLNVGEFSNVFEDEDGYHIIYYLRDEPAGIRDLEDMRSFIETELLTEIQNSEWNALIDAWVADTEFVNIDQELLDSVA